MQAIHSIYAEEQDWAELLSEFVEAIPARMQSIEEALTRESLPELLTLVHQLRGACGSYGFQSVTDKATDLELTLRSGKSISEMEYEFRNFLNLLGNMTAGPR